MVMSRWQRAVIIAISQRSDRVSAGRTATGQSQRQHGKQGNPFESHATSFQRSDLFRHFLALNDRNLHKTIRMPLSSAGFAEVQSVCWKVFQLRRKSAANKL
jgi:hypothetical protein